MDANPPFEERLKYKTTSLEKDKTYLVGVAIFRPAEALSTTDAAIHKKYEFLIVKRTEHEEPLPNNWEILGGHVEPGETVRDCVEREALEETGLVVQKILGEFDELHWDSRSGKKNVQFNYAVTVEDILEIRLNPEEHSEWVWTREEEVDGLLMTPAMNKVLKDSFTFSESSSDL